MYFPALFQQHSQNDHICYPTFSDPNNLNVKLPIANGGYWDCDYKKITRCTAQCKNGKDIKGNALCNRKNTKGWKKTKTKLKDLNCDLA